MVFCNICVFSHLVIGNGPECCCKIISAMMLFALLKDQSDLGGQRQGLQEGKTVYIG